MGRRGYISEQPVALSSEAGVAFGADCYICAVFKLF